MPDKKYGSKSKNVNAYAETYMLDENGQLERRLAVGDKSFILKHIKNEKDREIMREIIEDIQKQLLTHNNFVQCFQDYRKENMEADDNQEQDLDKNLNQNSNMIQILDSDEEQGTFFSIKIVF